MVAGEGDRDPHGLSLAVRTGHSSLDGSCSTLVQSLCLLLLPSRVPPEDRVRRSRTWKAFGRAGIPGKKGLAFVVVSLQGKAVEELTDLQREPSA